MSAIRLGTAANVRGFHDLLDELHKTSPAPDHETLQDEFGRLRVWSGNLGALQKGHSSLDYRLRDSPLLSSNVLKLLHELKENLTAGMRPDESHELKADTKSACHHLWRSFAL
jgi:hypothetical protein